MNKVSCNINDFLRVTICLNYLKKLGISHLFFKFCEKRDVRATERIYGLPIVTDGNYFCICNLCERSNQIKSLARNILILINDYVLEIKFLFHFFDFTKNTRRLVNHILKVNSIILIQVSFVLQITIITNIQEQSCTHVLRRVVHTVKFFRSKSVRLKVGDKSTNEVDQLANVAIFF